MARVVFLAAIYQILNVEYGFRNNMHVHHEIMNHVLKELTLPSQSIHQTNLPFGSRQAMLLRHFVAIERIVKDPIVGLRFGFSEAYPRMSM